MYYLHMYFDATYYVRAVSGVYEDLVVRMHFALHLLRPMAHRVWLAEKAQDKQVNQAETQTEEFNQA